MKTSQSVDGSQISRLLAWLVGIIFVVAALGTPFIVLFGSNFGHLDFFRACKEIMLIIAVFLGAYLAWQNPKLKDWILKSWLVRLIVIYGALQIIYGLLALNAGRVNGSALIYAWLINLRFLAFFLVVVIACSENKLLERNWQKLILIPASIVVGFGLLQRLLLPQDFLTHFGYGKDTIAALQTVDNKLTYQRIQSTLRGANPLGAYLVVVLGVGTVFLRRWRRILFLTAGIIVLGLTYSRSAWAGAAITGGLLLYWFGGVHKRLGRYLLPAVIVTAGLLLVVFVVFRHQSVVENTLFHTDQSSHSSESSNAGRARAIKNGLHDVVHEPLGRGPGTAGPASVRNNHPARIAENYYLQVAQEVGWLGLGIFVAINIVIAQMLWKAKNDPLALALLAALAGVTVVNLVSHAWTDDALAYIWWGLAAIAVSPGIMAVKDKHYAKKKNAIRQT